MKTLLGAMWIKTIAHLMPSNPQINMWVLNCCIKKKKKGQFLALAFPTLEMARLSQTLALDLDSI